MIRSIVAAFVVLAGVVIYAGQDPGEIVAALLGTGIALGAAGWLWHVEKHGAPGRPPTRDIDDIEDYANTDEEV